MQDASLQESMGPIVDRTKENLVSTDIAEKGMSPEDAAKKWVEANPDKVDAWLKG